MAVHVLKVHNFLIQFLVQSETRKLQPVVKTNKEQKAKQVKLGMEINQKYA
jgi:hypothetical protein